MSRMENLLNKPNRPDQGTDCDPESFCRIAAILHAETGITLDVNNVSLVVSRLSRHLRRLQLPTFAAFVDWVSDPKNKADHDAMVTALTTNTTHFFREPYHFDILVSELLPSLKARAEQGERVRLWSAGCSSGEEPYSLAATLLYNWPEVAQFDVRILATDISASALETARSATYPRGKLDTVPDNIRKLMLADSPADSEDVVMPKALRDLVTVRYLNFVTPWPTNGPFQAIMCRNVAIYMDDAVQTHVFTGLYDMLAPGGLLFIGHSERLPQSLGKTMTMIDRTSFRRA